MFWIVQDWPQKELLSRDWPRSSPDLAKRCRLLRGRCFVLRRLREVLDAVFALPNQPAINPAQPPSFLLSLGSVTLEQACAEKYAEETGLKRRLPTQMPSPINRLYRLIRRLFQYSLRLHAHCIGFMQLLLLFIETRNHFAVSLGLL